MGIAAVAATIPVLYAAALPMVDEDSPVVKSVSNAIARSYGVYDEYKEKVPSATGKRGPGDGTQQPEAAAPGQQANDQEQEQAPAPPLESQPASSRRAIPYASPPGVSTPPPPPLSIMPPPPQTPYVRNGKLLKFNKHANEYFFSYNHYLGADQIRVSGETLRLIQVDRCGKHATRLLLKFNKQAVEFLTNPKVHHRYKDIRKAGERLALISRSCCRSSAGVVVVSGGSAYSHGGLGARHRGGATDISRQQQRSMSVSLSAFTALVGAGRLSYYGIALFGVKGRRPVTPRSVASVVAFDFFGSMTAAWVAFAAGVLHADDVTTWATRFVLSWGILVAFCTASFVFRPDAGRGTGAVDERASMAAETFVAAAASVAISFVW